MSPKRQWALRVVGVGACLVGASAAAMAGWVFAVAAPQVEAVGPPYVPTAFDWLLDNVRAIAGGQVAVGCVAAAAGVGLLKRRRWAAQTLMLLACGGVLMLVLATVAFVVEVWSRQASAVTPEQHTAWVTLLFGPIAVAGVWSLPLLLAIRVLRRSMSAGAFG
jgi:hypothetical protein